MNLLSVVMAGLDPAIQRNRRNRTRRRGDWECEQVSAPPRLRVKFWMAASRVAMTI